MLRTALFLPLFFLALLSAPFSARAAMEIEVVGGAANKIAIALLSFGAAPSQPAPAIAQIVGDDLKRSGQFSFLDTSGIPPAADITRVNAGAWRSQGAEAVVVGQVVAVSGGRYEVKFRLLDAVKQTQLAGFSYTIAAGQWRTTAHQIADIIYEKLTGTRGAFSSRIAYVQKQGKRYELKVADADGQNPRTVVRSG